MSNYPSSPMVVPPAAAQTQPTSSEMAARDARLAAELQGELPRLNDLAARIFATANAAETHGTRRKFERVGIRIVDLITAIASLEGP